MHRVAIVGIAQTKFEAQKIDQNYAELAYEVTQSLFNQLGIGYEAVENVVTASSDFWDGRTISSMAVQDAVGVWLKSETKVSSDGSLAVLYGMMRILSGSFGTTLVLAHCKSSEGQPTMLGNAVFDPIYQRQLGFDLVAAGALQARAYLEKYNLTELDLAEVIVKNLGNATLNPNAQRSMSITIEDALKANLVADPLREFDIAPNSDGACAILLAREDLVSKFTDKPVWLSGVGHYQDNYYLGDRDLTTSRSLEKAAAKAYSMAGISNPRKELNVVELYDTFSYQELIWTELLGLAERGKGVDLIRNGVTKLGGELPVNPSGGVLGAHAMFVAGLVRVAEAAKQLRGEAGAYQVDGARKALAHGTVGPCGQTHCVWILSNNK
ncbi:MAG: thiolase family protein [Acidobacteria bacterium]|nr:thiolase family protein [Acidobacteriota bacterium]